MPTTKNLIVAFVGSVVGFSQFPYPEPGISNVSELNLSTILSAFAHAASSSFPSRVSTAPLDNTANFDARTVVNGITNSDTLVDKGYVVEMRYNLDSLGYNAQNVNGDIVEFNIAIYDMDWLWPDNPTKKSATKVWWQNGWANGNNMNVGRVMVNPAVTINSTTIPTVGPDFVIKNGANFTTPVIDGKLDDYIWKNGNINSFRIKYGDNAIRAAYSNVGATRSGQYQPQIDGKSAAILDPGDATLKYFFKNDTLYVGIDVTDQVICGEADYDKWDGVMLTMESRDKRDGDNRLQVNELKIRFDKTRKDTICEGTLLDWVKAGTARIKYALKGTSTLDNLNDIDQGYTIELAISLRQLGYPAGRGDGVLFMGATLFDYDAFTNAADNYASRAWWFREAGWSAGPAWCYMDPATMVLGVKETGTTGIPQSFELIGNYPNPFNPSTVVKYSMPEAGYVTINIYDVVGKLIKTQILSDQSAGVNSATVTLNNLSTGVYFYQVKMVTKNNNAVTTPYGKMMLMK